jgi:hypothetical protein
VADDERRPREPPPYWIVQDDVARDRVADLGRRVGDLEERADGIAGKVDGLAAAEANRRRRGDDITGVGKVLVFLASVGGAVLAWLSYARH